MTKTTNLSSTPDLQTLFSQFTSLCEDYLGRRAPSIPVSAKEFIVKYSPYFSVLAVVLALPALIFAFGLGAYFAPFTAMAGNRYGPTFSFGTLFVIATLILEALAIPGLFKRQLSAWTYLYYAALINALHSLISFDLGGLILGTVISLYILFQVKSYYR